MKSFRNPKYLERYEDVVFDLEKPLALPGDTDEQKRDGIRFVADNTGDATPFDGIIQDYLLILKLKN